MNLVPKQAQKQEDWKKGWYYGGVNPWDKQQEERHVGTEFVNLRSRTRDKQDIQICFVIPKYIIHTSFSRGRAGWPSGRLARPLLSEPFYQNWPAWVRKIEAADRQETQAFTVQGNHSAACCDESWCWSLQKYKNTYTHPKGCANYPQHLIHALRERWAVIQHPSPKTNTSWRHLMLSKNCQSVFFVNFGTLQTFAEKVFHIVLTCSHVGCFDDLARAAIRFPTGV